LAAEPPPDCFFSSPRFANSAIKRSWSASSIEGHHAFFNLVLLQKFIGDFKFLVDQGVANTEQYRLFS